MKLEFVMRSEVRGRHAGRLRQDRSSFIIHHSALILLCAAVLAEPAQAFAQQYPARPIRFVLGFAPGGASDTMARVIATRLSESLGQPVVIDCRRPTCASA
jgi:hypothetical protein